MRRPGKVQFNAWAELGELSGELQIAGALSLHDWYPKPGEMLTAGSTPVAVRVTVEILDVVGDES